MRIGIPKETHPGEKRVMLLPDAVRDLTTLGEEVIVEHNAAIGIHIEDLEYTLAGAIIGDKGVVYSCDLVVQLKRPEQYFYQLLENRSLLCMGHCEEEIWMQEQIEKNKVTLFEMEKILDDLGERVINQCGLTGEVAVYNMLQYMDKLPTDIKAVVIGGGNTSQGALKACNKLGIETKLVRRDHLPHLVDILQNTDLLINGIPWTNQEKFDPNLRYILTRKQLDQCPKTLAVLDLVCAEPPCPIETLRPTTFEDPCYEVDGRKHISLWGYPGLVPVSSAKIYSEQVLPIVFEIARCFHEGQKKLLGYKILNYKHLTQATSYSRRFYDGF